jgi:hypothetical protein
MLAQRCPLSHSTASCSEAAHSTRQLGRAVDDKSTRKETDRAWVGPMRVPGLLTDLGPSRVPGDAALAGLWPSTAAAKPTKRTTAATARRAGAPRAFGWGAPRATPDVAGPSFTMTPVVNPHRPPVPLARPGPSLHRPSRALAPCECWRRDGRGSRCTAPILEVQRRKP